MYQKIIIVGNLGRDPEMRYTPDGKAVTTFSVAASERYKGEEKTAWFRVTVWGKQAESAAQYLGKGSRVLIEGKLQADPATGGPRLYQRKDGSWGAQFEVTASRVVFLSRRAEDARGGGAQSNAVDDVDF